MIKEWWKRVNVPYDKNTMENYRHPFLTIVLSLIIIGNLILMLRVPTLTASQYGTPEQIWGLRIIASLALLNILFMLAIVWWKRWGFYGYLVISLGVFCASFYSTHNLLHSIQGIGGVLLLLVALFVGGKNKGWSKLR